MTSTAPEPGAERLILGAAAAAAAIVAWVWTGGHLAAALAGHPQVPITIEDTAAAVTHLPSNISNPAAAWPAPIAAGLPGPFLYWAAHLAIGAAAAALGWLARIAWQHTGGGGHLLGIKPHQGITSGKAARHLRVHRPTPGRVTLGRAGSALIAAPAGASVAVIGPTGSGKTAGLAIPAMREWQGPVIATSVKGDLLAHTIAHRSGHGRRVWIYDPTSQTGRHDPWTPLSLCHTWVGALRVAGWLTDAARARRDTVSDGDYWYSQARKALAPHLYAAARDGKSMSDVVRWIDTQEQDAIRGILARQRPEPAALDALIPTAEEIRDGFHPGGALLARLAQLDDAATSAEALWKKEERVRSSIYATVENVIAAYADPAVGDSTGAGPIDLRGWLNGDNTIYVVAPPHEQDRLRPVLAVLIQAAIRAAYDTANANGGALQQPCLALLDEAGNIAAVADLPTYASTARSHRITLVTVWQDLAQLRGRYGDHAHTVLNNHAARVFTSGIADAATLDYLSRLVGTERRVDRNFATDLATHRRSISHHTSYQPAAPPDVLRRLRPDRALLIYGHQLPIQVRLRPHYRPDRTLRPRVRRPSR